MKFHDLQRFKLPDGFRGRGAFFVQFWWIFQSVVIGCSPQFMYGWRRFWFRAFGAKIGKGVILRPSVRMTYPWKVRIGDWSWIGDNVELYSLGEISIGDHVVVSQNTYVCTGTHDITSYCFDMIRKPIFIQDEAWIASDVFIAPGITIGFGCVVGARSTVFADLPPESVCAGSPAKVIRWRKANLSP